MSIDQGESKSYSESRLQTELAVIDTTDPKFDDVVAIPTALLRNWARSNIPGCPSAFTRPHSIRTRRLENGTRCRMRPPRRRPGFAARRP